MYKHANRKTGQAGGPSPTSTMYTFIVVSKCEATLTMTDIIRINRL